LTSLEILSQIRIDLEGFLKINFVAFGGERSTLSDHNYVERDLCVKEGDPYQFLFFSLGINSAIRYFLSWSAL
jgi:hypothetical protein